MDPFMRADIEGLLADLWSGTDIELALSKAGLEVRRVPHSHGSEEVDATIEGLVEFTRGQLQDMEDELREEVVTVREHWDGPSFDAVSWEDLYDWIRSWPGERFVE